MSLFKQYLEESIKEHKYRIKSVFPLEGLMMDRLERHLAKYDVINVTPSRKTPIQKNPLEFNDIENEAVYIVDITTRLPFSQDLAIQELAKMFRIPEKWLVIRSENDPLEMEQERIVDQEESDEYKVKLSTDPEYPVEERGEHEVQYGDDYNEKMLSHVSKVRAERKAELDELNKKFSGVKNG